MDDHELDVELQDLATDEVCELLAESGAEISPEQAQELARFVADSGGIEEALAALAQLRAA